MALDLSRERHGSKAPKEEYVSGAEILSRINGSDGGYVSGAEIMARIKAGEPVKQANRFLVDRDKFYRAVDMDTSGENQFNAADYFEERKKQAEELKTRAAAMSLYMNDHADSFSEESYERMMNILSTFDTDVDDVMNRYQPSIDARTGMRAYEDELIAAMERNAQLQQVYDLSDRYSDRPVGAMYDLMNMFRKPADESERAVKDNWTAEQRYRLGLMQMEDPNQAKKYAAQINTGQDPYLLYQQQEQQKASWLAMDLDAEKREIDRLKAELDDYYWNANYDATATNARNAFDQEIRRREQEISNREQQYNLAKREQESAQFQSAVDQSDFAAKSGYAGTGFELPTYVEDADPDEMVYEYINNPDIRSQINQQTTELAAKGYDLLNEEEVGIYNYYYATEGPAKAQQYLDNIQDTLNQRIGERGAETKQGNIWKQLMAGAISGYSNAVTAPQYFFDKDSDYINTNPSQYMSAAIREDLADTGPVIPGMAQGASLGQIAFDLVNTTANMAPSILLSTAANAVLPGSGVFIGAATMGLSSAGGAYQQALNAGYSKKQSRAYAALSGASEAGMEYLLGGISKLGGEIPQKVLSDIVRGVDNAIAKAALTIGGDMVSEGFEEGLQEIITPWLENLVLYADKDVNWDDVAYSTLLGALSGAVMEGPGVAVNTSRVSRVDKQLQNLGAKGNTWDLAELIVKHRSGEQLSQEDYIKLVKSEPAMKILDGMRSAESEPVIANMTTEQVEEMKPTTSADGNARQISRNESINVDGFAEVKDGKASVKTDSGTVDYSDVSFGTEKQGNQYFAVESLPSIDTAHANDLLRTIQNADVGNDTAEVVAIREAYRLGYMGSSTQDLRGSDAKILPTNLQDKIYDIGRQQRSANDYDLSDRKIARLEATIARQRATEKAKITQVRETQEVQKQRKHVEDNAKKLMMILTNPTKDAHAPMALQEPLQKFLDSIDFTSNRYASGGSATIKDRSYINALAKVRDAIKGQRTALTTEDGVFTLDVPPEFTEEIDKHINMVSDATEGLDLTTNRIYEMTSAELKDLNYILNTINKAIRDIDRMHMQGEKARTSDLARDTMQEMQNRKPIKGEKGNWFVWNNYTPFHAFRRYGKAAMKIFDGLKAGQAKLARTIDSVVKFTEKTYTAKEVKEWEHNRHEIKLDSGKTVTMSSAQIMTFWCLSHRDQAIPHMQGAGIRMTTLEKFVGKANTQKELVQKDHFSLTLEDVNRINQLLTDRQRTVAREMQQFMQNFGGKLVNEISMARWDFMAATEKDYFPIDTVETSRDVKNPDQKKTSLFALLNKSFTKAPVQNARNAMVIDSIFNVFAKHMSEVAEYNAFALPLVDTMKWFNYRENVDVGEGHIHDVGVNRSIRDTLGTEAIQYFVDLMTDINSSQKAGRHEDFFGKILGRSKAASVAWNTRVAIQQISALPRASMILNYKSLIKGASKVRLKYATQEMMKYSGIALWKSMGYYDLNVGKSVERQIKGDTSIVDKFNEVGMWLPGKMDERTWARIWIATKDQVQNTTHLTGEDLLQATAKKFEEVVYETQVVDSVLTKSSFMRDKNLFIKEATSFMAEPTLAINILMSAFQDYEEGHSRSEKVKRGLMIGFTGYALAGVVNALLGSFSDAWRDDDEFEDYWEKYRQALFGEKFFDGNLFSELNPIEKIAFVKDILSVTKGNEPHSTYSKLMTDAVNLINSYQSIADGKGSKTAYGVVYQTLQYLSAASGVGMSNMTREVIDVWNNTIGKINPEKRILRHKPDNGDELLNAIQKGTEEDIQRVFGRFENQQKAESALQSAIRAKYVAGEMTAEEAEDLLTTNFDRDDEHEVYWILEEWDYAKENGNTEGYTKYGTFFEAIDSGEDYTAEMDRLMAHGAEASEIRSQISRKYRKQYLADETAREEIREKLLPVYEATGMYASDIEDKFNDWDFEAEYGMTYGEFKAEYREGLVTETQMREAMKSYGLMQYEIAEGIRELNDEIKFVNKYDMTLTEMKDAYDHGDISRNQMTNALVFTGMTQTEAKKWVTERDIENRLGIDYAKLDDAYKYNDISRTTLYNAMIEHGATKQEADEAILGYDWLKKNVRKYPDLAISDAKKYAVRISTNAPDYTLEDFGVKIDDYIQYSKLRPDCKGVDNNGDGQADSGTKRDAIFRMIDSLPISSEAKDGLALIDYGMKSIKKNAPWH